ncbi:hypothetical protein D477_012720 [Arthrobacter crystallopoietes BAB-32]|uniref:Cation-transporting ATPase n=1 Tax=Arthrobacter crystallopoietes BAB-32 TaxID=1246476 RepID=N1UTV1_9MICC|nr:hypothetical protein D477_012720 [Arthrobacter crystallopoietes BAB-32]
MFDKFVRKGKQMAGEYVKDQLRQRTSGNRPGNQRQPGSQYGNQQYGNQPYGGQQYGNQPYGNQPYGGQSYGNQPGQNQPYGGRQGGYAAPSGGAGGMSREDQAAIAKYKYMLRTAPPEDMERAHAEAFARLTPEQRSLLLAELTQELPPAERPRSDQPQDLARAATRAEVSRPGFMEQMMRRGGSRRSGMGGMAAGAAGGLGAGLLAGVAGAFIGTAIAGPLLDGFTGIGEELGGAAEGLADGVAGAGEEISAAGEGLAEQGGGLFDGFFGDGGGAGGDFGDFEL